MLEEFANEYEDPSKKRKREKKEKKADKKEKKEQKKREKKLRKKEKQVSKQEEGQTSLDEGDTSEEEPASATPVPSPAAVSPASIPAAPKTPPEKPPANVAAGVETTKAALNKAALAALGRQNTCDLEGHADTPEGPSETGELKPHIKNIRHNHLNAFARSMKRLVPS